MSEEAGLSFVVKTTEYMLDTLDDLVKEGIPPEILLACLIKVTRVYADKCSVSLDKVRKALETAGN